LYREAASAVGVAALGKEMRSSQLIDGKVWNGSDPAGYARSFKLHAMSDSSALLASR
jgi:nitrate/nitrite transport system substrate-binding protein